MDLLNELESMATNIDDEIDVEYSPAEDEIARWQNLFSYSYVEAVEHITNQRYNLSRCKVSDDLWTLVQPDKEAAGYSRAAFEHELSQRSTKPTLATTTAQPLPTNTSAPAPAPDYLVLLSGPLTTPHQIQTIAALPSAPPTLTGDSEKTGESHSFCRISFSTKQILRAWLAREAPLFASTFIRVSQARKDLSATSIYPTLGTDSTLPQHRLPSLTVASTVLPAQDQYPVPYFFYGTLADPACAARVMCLPSSSSPLPVLTPATITRGVLKTWSGKYKALVDAGLEDVVEGFAYEVETREREEALCVYETELYEVVRCEMEVEGRGGVRGLTFRFVGPFRALDGGRGEGGLIGG